MPGTHSATVHLAAKKEYQNWWVARALFKQIIKFNFKFHVHASTGRCGQPFATDNMSLVVENFIHICVFHIDFGCHYLKYFPSNVSIIVLDYAKNKELINIHEWAEFLGGSHLSWIFKILINNKVKTFCLRRLMHVVSWCIIRFS